MRTVLIILFASLTLAIPELLPRSGGSSESLKESPSPPRSRSPARLPNNPQGQTQAASPPSIPENTRESQPRYNIPRITHTRITDSNTYPPDPRYAAAKSQARIGVRLNGPGSFYLEHGIDPSPGKKYRDQDMFTWPGPGSRTFHFSHPEKLRVHVAGAPSGASLLATGRRASAYIQSGEQSTEIGPIGSVQSQSGRDGPHHAILNPGYEKELASQAWSTNKATANALSPGDEAEISASASNSPLSTFNERSSRSPSPSSPSRRFL